MYSRRTRYACCLALCTTLLQEEVRRCRTATVSWRTSGPCPPQSLSSTFFLYYCTVPGLPADRRLVRPRAVLGLLRPHCTHLISAIRSSRASHAGDVLVALVSSQTLCISSMDASRGNLIRPLVSGRRGGVQHRARQAQAPRRISWISGGAGLGSTRGAAFTWTRTGSAESRLGS